MPPPQLPTLTPQETLPALRVAVTEADHAISAAATRWELFMQWVPNGAHKFFGRTVCRFIQRPPRRASNRLWMSPKPPLLKTHTTSPGRAPEATWSTIDSTVGK